MKAIMTGAMLALAITTAGTAENEDPYPLPFGDQEAVGRD
jgi:hypothetical protein